ncbi:MAG: hypothetical protein HY815_16630 [Candidatus Riflebacteria bacterium]|nr:hypothetical protein [Candidatus Riflebacteria bacterium]
MRHVVEVISYSTSGMRKDVVTFQFAPELPAVRSDPTQLEQVFANLLSNAFDAIGPMGSVQVVGSLAGDRVAVEIRDDGCGILSENLHRVFDPFFTTKPAGKGTGLGLAICYTLVQKLGGEIQLWSTTGKGTTVRVTLPLEGKNC